MADGTSVPRFRRIVRGTGVVLNLVDEAEANVRSLLDEMGKNPAQYGASGRQIGDFYASWMDVEGIEARGTAPLKPYLDRIAAAKDRAALQVLFASPDYASPVNLGILPSPDQRVHVW